MQVYVGYMKDDGSGLSPLNLVDFNYQCLYNMGFFRKEQFQDKGGFIKCSIEDGSFYYYKGGFNNNEMHGCEIITHSNGLCYAGEWNNDKEGKG